MLCPYKNLFGEPRQGIHSFRFMDFAIFDILITMGGAFLIHYYTQIHFIWCLLGLFLLGIFVHYIFCVDTTLNRMILPCKEKC